MSERTSYEPGVPTWVDLGSPDPAASRKFYGELFGWDATEPVEEFGGYHMFTLRDKLIAGIAPLMDPNQPPAWSAYIATDDADATARKAKDAGAQIVVEPMDIPGSGRMTMFAHPGAGFIGAWQAAGHNGSQIVNEPSSVNWNELLTRDVEGAKAFGKAVFGWEPSDMDMGGGMTYTIFNVGERGIAGAAPMDESMPAEIPAFWLTYFGVEDTDAAIEKIKELGGSLRMGPMDIEGVGRFAAVADPHGVTFGIIKSYNADQ